jgi:ABC-2 type transport system ATP-binding protein
MRRRLDLAMGLMGNPRVVFLDEPTTGLDPRSRRAVWQIVRDLVADGVTIL